MTKKVLYMSVTSIIGGGSEVIYSLAKSIHNKNAIDKNTYQIVYAGPNDGLYFEKIQNLGVKAYSIPLRSLSLSNLSRIIKICKSESIDIIHSHGKGAGIYGRIVGFLLNIKVIHSFHGFHYNHFGFFLRHIYLFSEKIFAALTDVYIFVSEGERDSFINIYPSVSLNKLKIVYNGIDPERLVVSSTSRKFFGISDSDFIFIVLSRISCQKGLEHVIKAMAYIKSSNSWTNNLKLIIIGDDLESESKYTGEPRYRQYIFSLIRELNLQDNVMILPKTEYAIDLLSLCDCCVNSSLGEGFSLSLLEAMFLGIPIIATNVTGNNEAIINNLSGCLVESANSEMLSQAMIKIINDEEFRNNIAAAARNRAMERYSYKKMIDNTCNIYGDLIYKDKI